MNRTRRSLIVFGAALALVMPLLGAPPRSLVKLERERAWKKARIEYTHTRSDGGGLRCYEMTIVGDDTLTSDRGDSEGVISRYRDGTPHPFGYGPFHSLQCGEMLWHYGAGQIYANVTVDAGARRSLQPRALGATASPPYGSLAEVLRTAGSGAFTESREDGFDVVRWTAGAETITWRLDPRCGNLPVQVVQERDGEIIAESRSDIDRFDGRWFPTRVEFYRNSYRSGLEPVEVIEVLSLEVEPSDVPDALTPAYIGIDTGMNMNVRSGKRPGEITLCKWDGEQTLTLEEFDAAAQAGRVRDGPLFLAYIERSRVIMQLYNMRKELNSRGGSASAPTTLQLESLTGWEKYTRDFIARYQLDSEQAQRALAVLRQCQEWGRLRLERSGEALEDWRRAAQQVMATTTAPSKLAEHAAGLREKLMKPLNEIFEHQLKPRLNLIPTRAQRKALERP